MRARPEASAPQQTAATRFGINAHAWDNGGVLVAEGFAAGHTIHRSLVYAAPLDVVERLQLQAWMAGDYA